MTWALPLKVLCNGPAEQQDTAEWAGRRNRDTMRQFSDLLRRTLVSDRQRGCPWHQARHHLHFRATRDLRARESSAAGRPARADRVRPALRQVRSGTGELLPSRRPEARYRRIGGTWFCQLEPDYCFTADGHRESPFADSLLAGIKRLDRHPAVLGWTRMWASHLAPQPDLFSPELPVVFGPLETVTVHSGIDDNWWGRPPYRHDSRGTRPPGGAPAAAAEPGHPATSTPTTSSPWSPQPSPKRSPKPPAARRGRRRGAGKGGAGRRQEGKGAQCTLK